MRKGGGKSKGSSYERGICVKLSLWVSGGKDSDLYWRAAMSGGRATVAHRAGKNLKRQAGDITATAPEGFALTDHFFLECKHVRSLDIESFLFKNKGALAGFWKVAIQEAAKFSKSALIIARQNRFPDLVISEPGTLSAYAGTVDETVVTLRGHKGVYAEVRLLADVLASPFIPTEELK